MINLFPKRIQSMSTPALLPSVMMSTDRDFNLIRIVTDHGPARIAQISERLERMAIEAVRLEHERTALERLIAAVTEDGR